MSFNPQNPNGSATSANSSPVVIASDQAEVAVKAGTNLNTSALATSAKQDTLLTELQLKADLTETQPVSLASVPSHAVTLAAGAAAIGKAEDVAAADADVGVPAMAVRKATPVNTSGTDGDYEMLQMSAGRVWASATIDAALPAGTALLGKVGIDQTTPGTTNAVAPISGQAGVAGGAGAVGATVQRTTLASDDPAVAVLGAIAGAAVVTDANGTIQQYLRGLVKLFITAGSALVTAICGGKEAHGGGITGNPFRNALRTIAHGTNPTQIAADLTTDWYANRHGIPFVMGGHPNIITAEWVATGAFTDDPILGTIASGVKVVVTRLSVMCSNANTVNTAVRIGFGTSTLPATGGTGVDATAGILLSHPGIAPGSGIECGAGAGILGIGADGAELRITNGAPTSGELRVVVSYYTIES